MRRHWILRGVKFAVFAVLFLALFGFLLMTLWNWLVPTLFGGRLITFWQALGLLILSKILLGGFRGFPRRDWSWRRRMMQRWEQMTPEEREKFRQAMRGRCRPFGSAATESKP